MFDDRDLKILHWVVRNRHLHEIAEFEMMSVDGVRSRLRVLAGKLKCEPTLLQIAMSALRAGVVDIPKTAPKEYVLDAEQIQFVRLVAAGLSNDEIGDRMGFNGRTAARRLRGIADLMGYERLEVIRIPVAVTGIAHRWIS